MAEDFFRIRPEALAAAEKRAARRRHKLLSKAQAKAVRVRMKNNRRKRRLALDAAHEVRIIFGPRKMRGERGGHRVMLERMEPGRCYTVGELAALMPEWPGGYRCVQPWLYQQLEPLGLVEKVRIREYSRENHYRRLHLFVWRLTEKGAALGGAAS